MIRLPLRAALACTLAAALAACGGDEPAATPETATEAKAAEPGVATTLPTLAAQSSPYQRAQRTLVTATSLHFEAEYTAKDGAVQYLSGVRQSQNYSFNLRSLPKASAELDGNWLFQGGRYLKQGTSGFQAPLASPDSHVQLVAAVAALPATDNLLAPASGANEVVSGVSCAPRSVDLSQAAAIGINYNQMAVCVDENKAEIVRLSVESRAGEKLMVTFNGYGDSVQMPNADVKEWWQEYPRQQ